MTRALIAARKSGKVRDNGKQRDGISLDTQDERAREFCQRQGWEIAGAPQDTISGRVAPIDRKALGKWLNDPAKLASFDVLVAFKSDRLSRGEDTDWSRIETWAADNGKTLVIVDGASGVRYPARDDSDYWQWTAAKRQAAREWADIRERSMRAQSAIRANGHLVGRNAFGYTSQGSKYARELVADARAELIPGIFERVTRGESLETVAQFVRDHGYPMYARTIGTIIRNPVYYGKRLDGYASPALVDATTWRNANLALDGKGAKRAKGSPAPKAMLAGVLKCGTCSAPMYRVNQGTRYRCAGEYGSDRTRAGKGCGNILDLVHVDSLVSSWMSASDAHMTEVRPAVASTTRRDLDEAKLARKALDDDSDDYDEQHAELTARIKALQVTLGAESDAKPFELVELAETYGQRWNSLDEAARGAWMRSSGVRIMAQPVSVEQWAVDASDERLTWLAGDDEISLMITGSVA